MKKFNLLMIVVTMAVIVVANDGKAAGTVVKNEAFGDTVYHNTIERIDLISTLSLHVNFCCNVREVDG